MAREGVATVAWMAMLALDSRRRGPEALYIAAKVCYNSLETLTTIARPVQIHSFSSSPGTKPWHLHLTVNDSGNDHSRANLCLSNLV